jgi:putative ABC transport system permease protein
MWKLTTRGLWAHKLRFTLTGLAVVLGVAFMAGTMILTDTMSSTFHGLFETNNAGIDVVVQRPSEVEAEFADTRERVDAAALDAILATEGVETAAGTIQGFAQLVDANGEARATDGLGGTIGMNWVDDADLNPFSIATGEAPSGSGEVVLDGATAEREGFELGDTVTVLAKGTPRQLTLVGTAAYGEVDGLPGVTAVAVDEATAQELFAEPGTFDAIAVGGDGSLSDEELATAVRSTLALSASGEFDVLTGAADTAEKQSRFEEDLSFFNQFLLAFAYIALFVGSFIIYNTFSIIVAQRSRDMAMLRAVGASRRQVLGSVLFESIGVGLVASAAGLGLGVVMSYGLRALLGAVGLDIPGGAVVISPGTIIVSAVVGVTVTVLSAVGPALRASRVAPIAALRDTVRDETASSIGRLVAGLTVTGLGVTAFASGVVGDGKSALSLLGLGAVTTIIGLFVLGPVIARPAIHLLAAPAPAVDGTTGRLARENAKRSPKRSAATASALMIGVALVGFITILAASTKGSVSEAVDRSLRADYVVDSGSFEGGGFSPELAGEVDELDEVSAVSPVRSAPVTIGDGSAQAIGLDTTTLDQVVDLDVRRGSLAEVHGDGIAVRTGTELRGEPVALGDVLRVRFSRTGTARLTVQALFEEQLSGRETNYVVGLDTFEANVTDQFDLQLYVKVAEGVTPEASRAALEEVLADWPNAELQDQAAFKADITSEIDRMLNLIYGLLALAVVIALIGIANTLALSVHERRREIGLLRAVGMTRRQVRRAVRWEAVAIALLGTALGTALAVGGAWGIIQALDGEVTTFVVPPTQLVVIVALAALAGVGAALGPARRAAKLDVLDAIAS